MRPVRKPEPGAGGTIHVVGVEGDYVDVRIDFGDGPMLLRLAPLHAMSAASNLARAARQHPEFSSLMLSGWQISHTPNEVLRTAYLFSMLGLVAGSFLGVFSAKFELGWFGGGLTLVGCLGLVTLVMSIFSTVTAWENPLSVLWGWR